MRSSAFDFASLFPATLPAPAIKWTGAPRYNFVGGHNDADVVPVDALRAAADTALAREGNALSNYTVNTGPQGYRPLREFVAQKLKRDAGISCTAEDIVMVSGSLQALDLVNAIFCERGDQMTLDLSRRSAEARLSRLIVSLFERLRKKGQARDNTIEFPLRQQQ